MGNKPKFKPDPKLKLMDQVRMGKDFAAVSSPLDRLFDSKI
jgi:hypothetical protein